MNVVTSKDLPGLSREAEEQHLKETLELIQHNVERYSKEVATLRQDIDDMQAHFHDDNPELINSLENSYTMYNFLSRTLERNERALKKPYFGRIDFHDETLDTSETFYIGKSGISKDPTHPVIIDWRAPVANVYYENGLGKCSYLSPEGQELPIDLKGKRTYEIADGKLIGMFDSEVVANDDLLTSYLSKNKQAVLGEIVATIQREQNEIIRKSPYHNCLVQGVAGSGKTTVAMHRISFILYNYADRFRPQDFYIVGSNRILLNYITGVLPDLDVYGVRQMTMEQLFVRLLYEDWDEKKYQIKGYTSTGKRDVGKSCAIKGTLSWFQDLEKFCRRLEWHTIPRESVYLNRLQFVEGFVDGKTGVHDMTRQRPAMPKDVTRLLDRESIERYIRENPAVSIQGKIDMLNERLKGKISDQFLGKSVIYTEAEQKAITKAYQGRFGGRSWKRSIFSIYHDFLNEQLAVGYDVDIPDREFDVYDLAALAYLYKRVKETDAISEAHHVVIDEAQDFGMMVYGVLKFCMKGCTYTIMGDVSQNIHFDYGLNDWEELKALYIKDNLDSFGILKKSYRNTVEISNFATNILHHGQFTIYPVEPIIRHGEAPQVILVDDRQALLRKAAEVCRGWQEKDLNTIAIICRDESAANKTMQELGQFIEIMDSPVETAEFGNGIMVLPVEFTKGLEFDAVLILDPTRVDYPVDDGHAKLLYVAATRALHELCVLHTGNLTGLIADPVVNSQPCQKDSNLLAQPHSPAQPQTQAQSQVPGAFKPQPRTIRRIPEPGTDTMQLLASKKLKRPDNSASAQLSKSTPGTGAGTSGGMKSGSRIGASYGTRFGSRVGASDNTPFVATPSNSIFGCMPTTDLLRPLGHAKTTQTIRWVTRQSDGLYLQSSYGTLRLSPVNSKILRVTFAADQQLLTPVHPKISLKKPSKEWMYRDTPKILEIKTKDLYLQVEKATGAIFYFAADKRPLLAERRNECRLLERPSFGYPRARLFLDWAKNETLFALGTGIRATLPLNNAARYISHNARVDKLPMVISDRGYGLVVASGNPVFCCTLPTHGTHICAEHTEVLDYYFIIGKNSEEIISTYGELCGKNS